MCCAKHENWLYCMNQLPLYIIHQEPLTNHTPAEALQWLTVSADKASGEAFLARNRKMVDGSSVLICYYNKNHSRSGTGQCVRYAQRQGLEIFNVAE